jgi:hypothetical protein
MRHDFYVSHTSIKHRPEERRLEIGIKLFTDDLIRSAGREFEKYLDQHFFIWLDGREAELTFSHFRYENDLTWFHLRVEEVCDFKQIKVHNSLLTDHIDEQVNIVQIKYRGEVKMMNLDKVLPDDEAKF